MLNPESNAPTERQQFWLKHLRACEASGQTTIDYAREHGLNAKSMYSARKGFAHKGPIPPPQQRRFQKVHVATDSNSLESVAGPTAQRGRGRLWWPARRRNTLAGA